MPLIENLQIENFKSLENAPIALKQITVLVGPNGSGKSSILQALVLLKQSRGSAGLNTSGSPLQLGSLVDITFGHDISRAIAFSLAGVWNLPNPLSPSIQSVRYRYRFAVDQQGTVQNELELTGQFPPLKAAWIRMGETGQLQWNFEGLAFNFNLVPILGQPFQLVGTSSRPDLLPAIRDRLNRTVENLFLTMHHVLGNIYFVPASRSLDQPVYGLLQQPGTDLASSGGSTAQGGLVAAHLNYKRNLPPAVSKLMEQITGVSVKGNLVPGPTVNVSTVNQELEHIVVNEGFGSNQLIFLLTQLVDAPPGSLVAIEEPEIHLHPRAQAALASVLVEASVNENKQLLITTHSEHFLIALLTKLASGILKQDQLAIYYADRQQNATKMKELVIDQYGRIEGGLEGFFEADVTEFENYLNAIVQKLDERQR